MSADHALRREHESNRSEAARVRKHQAHESEACRAVHDRWWRRLSPLMPSETPVVVQDFETECTL